MFFFFFFLYVFFQAEDGIRDLVRSRGLGDVYKRQIVNRDVLFLQALHFTCQAIVLVEYFAETTISLSQCLHYFQILGELAVKLVMLNLHDRAPVSYTHLRAHETVLDLVCRLLLEKKTIKDSNKLHTNHIYYLSKKTVITL